MEMEAPWQWGLLITGYRKKIEIFVWRTRLRRIPAKVELDKRGGDLGSTRCSVCDNDVETMDHILLHCPFAKDAVEWVSGYLIWKNRNQTIFRGKKGNGPMILNEIQVRSFEWISKRSRKTTLDWNQWLLNPKSFDDKG
ncbi:uncharacterized protein [Rutidosis leptorrhynchoides]|uniref:uncharacterized protein n=1 Tax=Rutidosis leptorrhynchoides TaxID=125765 RepID=UPI003A99D25F